MSSVVRVPLCRWRDTQGRKCPGASDPGWHCCWNCGALEVSHAHVGDRGMGGRKGHIYIVALCIPCHEKVTRHEWTDGVVDYSTGPHWYLEDENLNVIAQREID